MKSQVETLWTFATVAALFLAIGCGEHSTGSADDTLGATTSIEDSRAFQANAADRLRATRARAAFITERQSEGKRDARYRVDPERLIGSNPAQGFETTFRREGIEIAHADDHWRLGLELKGIECDGRIENVLPAGSPAATASNRVAYSRRVGGSSLTEWYENGPMGIEQGFTLSESPCGTGARAVTVLVGVQGLQARERVSELIEFIDRDQQPRLWYSDLHAADATGGTLATRWYVTQRGELALQFESAQAVWPVVVDPLIWGQQRKLLASDGTINDNFGYSVALSGDTALVSANVDDVDTNSNQGSAYIFVRSATIWSQQSQLTASDGAAADSFGSSVALLGDTALVGASYDDVGANSDQGSAHVFIRSGTSWFLQSQLTASDGGAGDGYGSFVALSSDAALVGAPGADNTAVDQGSAYIFARSGTTWGQQAQLTASDGAASDFFGGSVALSSDTALVGAYGDDVGANANQGSAYVFIRSGTSWSLQSQLTASDGAANDSFGSSLALFGDTALIGSLFDAVGANTGQGSAYVFTRSGTTWLEEAHLTALGGSLGDQFGCSVALSSDIALIGARYDNIGAASNRGSAYVFNRSGTAWSQRQQLTASDGAANDQLGYAVAMSPTIALVGAPGADFLSNGAQGAAYTFNLGFSNADSCSVDADCASDHCVQNVCCNVACTGTCQTCLGAQKASGADGVCGNVKVDTDPRNSCDSQTPDTCGTTGDCDGAGGCLLFSAGTECAPASCATPTSEDSKDTCDGSGTCVVTSAQACETGYACVSGACKSSCSVDGDCDAAAGYICNSGACSIPAGEACQPFDTCETTHCVDGFCCESVCNGECEGCANSLTGMGNGVCAAIPADQDPKNDCPTSVGYPDDCQADGVCDGQRACRAYAKAGTACGATVCASGTVSGQVCNGSGQCDQDDVFCAPYLCAGDACGTGCASNDDCDASGYCISGGTCALAKEDGSECNEAFECASGYCVDGVCCEDDCVGQCSACAEVGSEGTCVAISGAPRGQREPCAGDLNVCGGECNGLDGSECTYPGTAKSCGGSCIDAMNVDRTCDGQGACVDGEPTSCGNYLCAGDDCATTCSTDSDCATGYGCDVDQCVPLTAQCIEDGAKSQPFTGPARECTPYRCDPKTGQCPTSCAFSTECAPGFVCNPTSTHCEEVKQSSKDESGCGCRSAGGSSGLPGTTFVALAGLGLLVTRRKVLNTARSHLSARTRRKASL